MSLGLVRIYGCKLSGSHLSSNEHTASGSADVAKLRKAAADERCGSYR